MGRFVTAATGLAAVLLLTGCAASSIPRPTVPGNAPLELTEIPWFPQRDHHCGPAALATVLGAGGVAVEPDELAPQLYVPGRHGTFQVELAAVPRRYGRLAVEIDGSLDGLVAQLQRGRPVLVLQNLAIESLPRWHYAVVVGYLPERDRFVLRSGGERRLLMARHRFYATWVRAGRWGVVVVAPESPPDGLAAAAWLNAAAGLESAGHHQAALAAFESAFAAWPDDPTAGLGRANNLYHLGRHPDAESAYRAVLVIEPEHAVALHNLATLLVETGRPCDALEALPSERAGESPLIAQMRGEARKAAGSVDCRRAVEHDPR